MPTNTFAIMPKARIIDNTGDAAMAYRPESLSPLTVINIEAVRETENATVINDFIIS
ncbi:hypothetical protein SDC9_126264 [bioreactor metagenome]|uniref:Uncharacterized protein n=1 Tax=bioreactor metagenome TaxID=1076179 RepID=A0A645CQM7_9ZZZZ